MNKTSTLKHSFMMTCDCDRTTTDGFQTSLSIQFHSQSCGMVFRYTPTWIIPSSRHIIPSHLFDKLTMVGFEPRFHKCSYLLSHIHLYFLFQEILVHRQSTFELQVYFNIYLWMSLKNSIRQKSTIFS